MKNDMQEGQVTTSLKTIFEVRLPQDIHVASFRFEDKDASDAEVSFDGQTWIPAYFVWKAVERFCDRFPNAIVEDN